MTQTTSLTRAHRIGWIAGALTVGLALPFLVHLIPVEAGPPMGARWLPIFLAAGLAAMRLDPISALAIAVGTPLINQTVTGMPAGPMLPVVLLELVVVVSLILAVRYLTSGATRTWLLRTALAPAYLLAAIAVSLLLAGDPPTATLNFAFNWSWPGLLTLAVAGAAFAPRNAASQ